MKRHISIFAFLLCAFAAVGPAAGAIQRALVVSTLQDCVENLSLTTGGPGGSYYSLGGAPLTAKELTGYRFLGWYTTPSDCDFKTATPANCTALLTTSLTISSVDGARICTIISDTRHPLLCPKFQKTYAVTTAVSPADAGTVIISGTNGVGTVDAGGTVRLTEKANAGWTFSKWSDGNTDSPTRTISSVGEDVNLTAQFIAKVYDVGTTQSENAKITVAEKGTYNEDLQIAWEPEGAAGYDYTFDSAQVLAGNTLLATYTETETPATFNMKDHGQYYSSVEVVVKYTKTAQNRDLKLKFSKGIVQIGYKIGNANAWTFVTADTTVPVPVDTRWQAYAEAADGYTTSTSETNPQSGTMGANGAEFAPQADLDGFQLTVDPNGEDAKFHKSSEPYTYSKRLRSGMSTLNELDDVATKADGSELLEYRDSKGEVVYDAQGHYRIGTYWDESGNFRGTGNLTVKAIWGKPPNHFTITAVCDPTVGGTVEPASTNVIEGKSATLTAKENAGYSFYRWTNSNGVVVSEDNPWTFPVTADATYTAVFTGNVYSVTYKTDGGKPKDPTRVVTFGAAYGEPPSVSQDGYELEGWYTESDGEGIRIDPDTKVFIAENHKLWAYWTEKTQFDVTFVDSIGKRSTTKPYPRDQPIGEAPEETKAWDNTDKGYWQDPNDRWDPPLTTPVTSNMTVTAKWISVSDILDCTNLMFTATGNWKPFEDNTAIGGRCMRMNDCKGTDNLTATLDKPGTLTFNWKSDGETKLRVKFGEDEKPLTFSGSGWKTETFEVPTAATSLTLQFSCLETEFQPDGFCAIDKVIWEPGVVKKYTLEVASAGNGTVLKSPDEDDYEAGAQVTITATPDPGYAFEKWSDGSAVSSRQITVTSNATYVATFTALPPATYTVTVVSEEHGIATKNPNEPQHKFGDVVTITATPDEGYAFEKWSDGSTAKQRQITVTSNAVYSASFTNCVYGITLNANGGSGGTTSVTATYGEALPTLDSLPSREGYALTGYFDAVSGGVKYYDANGTGARNWDRTAGAELYAQWENDVGALSRILNCDNLRFESTVEGWEKCEDPEICVAADDPCLKSQKKSALITAKIKGKGTLTFLWSGRNFGKNNGTLLVKLGGTEKQKLLVADKATDAGAFREWTQSEPLPIDTQGEEMELDFICANVGTADDDYLAIDHVTWKPDRKEPEYADTDTPVTGFSMADGKIGFSFVGDGSTYHLLGTNDLVAPMPWPMVFETNKASGTIIFDIPVKADEPKMFYRIRALQ